MSSNIFTLSNFIFYHKLLIIIVNIYIPYNKFNIYNGDNDYINLKMVTKGNEFIKTTQEIKLLKNHIIDTYIYINYDNNDKINKKLFGKKIYKCLVVIENQNINIVMDNDDNITKTYINEIEEWLNKSISLRNYIFQ